MVAYEFTARDGTKLLFREPSPKDAPGLMQFINPIISERRSGLLISKRTTLAEEKAWLKGWITDIRKRKSVMLLAELDGRIVGNCTASRWTGKCSHVADIGIALARPIRGKGVGRELMERTMALAAKRMKGIEIMELKVFNYNERALRLYESMGFVEAGRIIRGTKEGKDYFDDITMAKVL